MAKGQAYDDLATGMGCGRPAAIQRLIIESADMLKKLGVDIQAINTAMETIDAEIFSYQGFRPAVIASRIVAARGFSMTDIAEMIMMVTLRGSNFPRWRESTGDAGKARLDMLVARYGLVAKVGQNKSTAVTLPRVATVFPTVEILVAAKYGASPFPQSVFQELPRIFWSSQLLSICSEHKEEKEALHMCVHNPFVIYARIIAATFFSRLVDKKQKKDEFDVYLQKQITIVKAGRTSGWISTATRKSNLNDLCLQRFNKSAIKAILSICLSTNEDQADEAFRAPGFHDNINANHVTDVLGRCGFESVVYDNVWGAMLKLHKECEEDGSHQDDETLAQDAIDDGNN